MMVDYMGRYLGFLAGVQITPCYGDLWLMTGSEPNVGRL